ncbi:MAG: hypothetical protein COA33_001875 [Fluviicola sp.]|nr:hypothetical protein [Fluviicola sp.]
MKLISISILSVIFFFVFSSCKKTEGPGGSSSIAGKVYAEVYDGAGNLLTEYDIAKEDVYIIYGNESSTFDDRVKTSFDGSFKFEYLETGNYQIFVYEKDVTSPSGKAVVLVDSQISKKKSTVDIGTITIKK